MLFLLYDFQVISETAKQSKVVQFIQTGISNASPSHFQNTISWIVLSVQVINNLGAENADFSNAKIKGTILSSVDEGAPFWSDESLWSCCDSTCQTSIKPNRTERGTRAIEYET